MKIFIGSSREKEEVAEEVAGWLERFQDDIDVLVWNEVGAFIPGQYTLDDLNRISEEVDAAVFIFAADDKTWYRRDLVNSVRDNVLFEYGLFCGKLSRDRVIFITIDNPTLATDLHGITAIKLGDKKREAQKRLKNWLEFINPTGKKTDSIQIKANNIKPFDDKGLAEQIIKINDTHEENWIEVKTDYSCIKPIEVIYSGIVVCSDTIDISSASTASIDFSFLDANITCVDLEFKNHKDNLFHSIKIKPEIVFDDKCTIDLSSLDDRLLKNIDEIVFCTKTTYFAEKENQSGSYKVRSISFI